MAFLGGAISTPFFWFAPTFVPPSFSSLSSKQKVKLSIGICQVAVGMGIPMATLAYAEESLTDCAVHIYSA